MTRLLSREVPTYVSNSLTTLYALLKRALLESRLQGAHISPKKRLLIVPSQTKKTWLCHQFACDGISLLDVDLVSAAEFFFSTLSGRASLDWQTRLFVCLAATSTVLQMKSVSLALFQGSFDEENCAQTLQEEFGEILDPQRRDVVAAAMASRYDSIELFGISSFAQSMLDFCCRLITHHGVDGSLYVLSPCLHFWSDVKTSQEIHWILDSLKRNGGSNDVLKIYEEAFFQRNDLLATLGVLARKFSYDMESRALLTSPAYSFSRALQEISPYRELVIPEYIVDDSGGSPSTLLSQLKADILCFTGHRAEKTRIEIEENSLICEVSSTPLQEVRSLFRHIIEKAENLEKLPVGSVIVQVPSLARYYDAFSFVFHEQQSIRVQYWRGEGQNRTLSYAETSSLVAWAERLLQFLGVVSDGKFRDGKQELVSWLSHPKTIEALLLIDAEDVEQGKVRFMALLEELRVDWYISTSHLLREMAAKGVHVRQKMPYVRDFCSLRDAIIAHITGTLTEEWSTLLVDHKMYDGFLRMVSFLEMVEGLWFPPVAASALHQINEWTTLLEKTVFGVEGLHEGDQEVFEAVFHRFSKLAAKFPQVDVPFAWYAEAFLKELSLEMTYRYPTRYEGHVIVAEKGCFDPVPAWGMVILGASQDCFPDLDHSYLLSRLSTFVPTISHDNASFDAAIFLDTLLSASSWCYISTVRNSYDKKSLPFHSFSSLVQELVRYVDRNFEYNDGLQFSQRGMRVSYEMGESFDAQRVPLPASIAAALPALSSPQYVTTDDLFEVAQDPMGLYMRSKFQVRGASLYRIFHRESAFGYRLRPSSKSSCEVLQQLLLTERSVQQQKRPSSWPKGMIGHFADACLGEKAEGIRNLSGELLPFEVALFERDYVGTDTTTYQPLVVSKCAVIGSLFHASTSSFMLLSKNWKQEMFQRLPEYLIRALLFFRDGVGCLSITQDGHRLPPFPLSEKEEFEELLFSWILFSTSAKNQIFPYTYRIVQVLLSYQNDPRSLQKLLPDILEEESEKNSALEALLPIMTCEYIERSLSVWVLWADRLYKNLYGWLEI